MLHEYGMVLKRDHDLSDVPPEALVELTTLLRMDPDVNPSKPQKIWLENQEAKVARLHASLRPPAKFLERFALRVNRLHRMPFFPQCAQLCWAHKGLDARVIRNLTLLVGHECTLRTDRFRSYRKKVNFPEPVQGWLDRIDGITAMWVGQHAFRMLYGYEPAGSALEPVASRCEACIMAALGGTDWVLGDLRASIIARKVRHSEDREPRLWRIIEEWINRFGQQRKGILGISDSLAKDINQAHQEIGRYKERKAAERAAKGKAPRERRRGRHRNGGRRTNGSSTTTRSTPTQSSVSSNSRRTDDTAPTTMSNGPSTTTCNPPPGPVHQDGEGEWNWLCNRMQGLSCKQQEEVLLNVHPAFSDFQAGSAVPGSLHPLNGPRPNRFGNNVVETVLEMNRQDKEGNKEECNGESWASCSVYSHDDQDATPTTGATERPHAFVPSDDDSEDDDANDVEDYVPVRQNWAPVQREDFPLFMTPPPPPASSFYSDHPGFPTNHKVTEVKKSYEARPPSGPSSAEFGQVRWQRQRGLEQSEVGAVSPKTANPPAVSRYRGLE